MTLLGFASILLEPYNFTARQEVTRVLVCRGTCTICDHNAITAPIWKRFTAPMCKQCQHLVNSQYNLIQRFVMNGLELPAHSLVPSRKGGWCHVGEVRRRFNAAPAGTSSWQHVAAQHREWDSLVRAHTGRRKSAGRLGQGATEESEAAGKLQIRSCGWCHSQCSVSLNRGLLCKGCRSVQNAMYKLQRRFKRLVQQRVDCRGVTVPKWSALKELVVSSGGTVSRDGAREAVERVRTQLNSAEAAHTQQGQQRKQSSGGGSSAAQANRYALKPGLGAPYHMGHLPGNLPFLLSGTNDGLHTAGMWAASRCLDS